MRVEVIVLTASQSHHFCPGERGVGDNDSYCDSEASMDDGSCYDNLEDVASPPPSDLSHQTLDLRHQDTGALRVSTSVYGHS